MAWTECEQVMLILASAPWKKQFQRHVQVGSYRYRSLIEGLYTFWKPYRSPIYPKLPTFSFPLKEVASLVRLHSGSCESN